MIKLQGSQNFKIAFSAAVGMCVLVGLFAGCGPANKDVSSNQMADIKSNYSDAPAVDWRDALISGNGIQGIMVLGDPRNERIIFNHEFLYEFLGTEDIEPADISDVMPRVKQLIKDRKYHEAYDLTIKEAIANGHPGLLWTDPYHPACAMMIEQSFEGDPENYKRAIFYADGEITVDWQADGIDYTRRSFVSRPRDVIATKISASTNSSINLGMYIQHQMNETELLGKEWNERFQVNITALYPERISDLNIPLVEPAEISTENPWQTFRVRYQIFDRGYEVVAQMRNKGGVLTQKNGKLVVEGADDVEIFSRVVPIEPYSHSRIEETKRQLGGIASYQDLLEEHTRVHSEIYNRVSLHLDKTGFKDGSNEDLLESQVEQDTINPYLLEKVFNLGLFGLISSSGENPPNLMGIWNGEWRPTWSGDFTTDANINLQISAANLAGQTEAIDSYMKMLERVAPDWEVNARNLHGTRGYVSGTRTSGRRNFHTHFGRFPGHYWTAGAGWLLNPCYEYVQTTGDEDFLVNRLLPMMKKTALFYEDFLDTYDENGKFLFAPSYSPENRPGNIEPGIAAVANAAMDIAVCRELLTNLINECSQRNMEPDRVEKWKDMLSKLPPYLVNEDGALKEWAREDLGDRYDHRHVSHLYPVWPGLEINPDETPDLYQAAVVAAQKRGRGNGSAHGLAHMALIGARLKKPELVYGNLLFLMKNEYLYRSLVTSHNPQHHIYNLDALHTIPGAVLEMLVYSRPGVIELLPALSEKLSKGTVTGVGCRTQAKVDELAWNFPGKRLEATISSGKKQDLKLQLRRGISNATVNGRKVDSTGDNMDQLNLSFNSGESKTIVLEWL